MQQRRSIPVRRGGARRAAVRRHHLALFGARVRTKVPALVALTAPNWDAHGGLLTASGPTCVERFCAQTDGMDGGALLGYSHAA